jgi:hypothetical protein
MSEPAQTEKLFAPTKRKHWGNKVDTDRGLHCSTAGHKKKRIAFDLAMREGSKKRERPSMTVVNQLIGAQMIF